MKKFSILFVLAMLCTLAASPAGGGASDTIIVTASMVTSAADIENTIDMATNYGERSGKVILDSSEGDFVFTGDDRSINIYHSNITLMSTNGAKISNCADGIFFDAVEANYVTITGISFTCSNLGIYGGVGHRNVSVINNTFVSGSFVIEAVEASKWTMIGNVASGPDYAFFFTRGNNNKIDNNRIEAYVGVFLENSSQNKVINNRINGSWHAIYLGNNASENQVIANKITNAKHAGISFAGGNEHNRVITNRVSCAEGFACLPIVIEDPPLSPTNFIR